MMTKLIQVEGKFMDKICGSYFDNLWKIMTFLCVACLDKEWYIMFDLNAFFWFRVFMCGLQLASFLVFIDRQQK